MTTKKWRLLVTPLSGNTPLHQLDVEAANWMGALRSARKELGEDGGVPPGASCSVAPNGTVTILDPASRRRFLLTPSSASLPPTSGGPRPPDATPAEAAQAAAAPAAAAAPMTPAPPVQSAPVVVTATAPAPATGTGASEGGKKKKFQTVAYTPGMEMPGLPGTQAAPAATAMAVPIVTAPAQAPAAAASAQPAATHLQPSAAAIPAPPSAAAPAADTAVAEAAKKKKKFETVAFAPAYTAAPAAQVAVRDAPAAQVAAAAAEPKPAPAPPAAPATEAAAAPPEAAAPAHPPVAQKLAAPRIGGATSQPISQPIVSLTPAPAPPARELELLLTRDEEPGPQNPLTYRERAFLIPRGMTVTEAEAALRFTLAELRRKIHAAPRGKFVNLAAFDHRWTDEPERPPLIVLEWRDWRGEPIVDYPAAERSASLAPVDHPGETDERIASVFESLHELSHSSSAAQALDFVVSLLGNTVPCAAISACLYDINTDELRFVALTGPGSAQRQGSATPRSKGLFGLAGRVENAAMVFPDARVHPSYDPVTDGREGLDTSSMLLRPLVHEGQLLGMLQLINRASGAFSAGDVHVVNYIGDRLGETLHQARTRVRS